MIEDKVRAVLRAYGIGIQKITIGILIADTETDIPHDEVL